MKRGIFLAVVVLGAASAPGGTVPSAMAAPSAVSAEALAQARVLSDRGRDFHDRGDYDRAVAAFQAAYVLAPSPGLLFNLGQAYRLKGDCASATLMYRAYLRSHPISQHRAIALAHLATVEHCASLSEIANADAAKTAEVRTGSSPPRPAGQALRRGGVITAMGGGVMLGIAGYFAYRAANASDEVAERYNRGSRWQELEELDARGRRWDTLAAGFALGGGIAAATGSVLYLLGRHQGERAERRPVLTLAPAPRGGTVRLTWEL